MTDSAPLPSGSVAVVLLAGGVGARAGFGRPKQLVPIGGKPVLRWSLDTCAAHPAIGAGVLIGDDDVVAAASPLPASWTTAAPGIERQQSVANALGALADVREARTQSMQRAARHPEGRARPA